MVFNETVFTPSRLQIVIGNTELYNFQIKNEKFTPLISLITRSYPGIFTQFFDIYENQISDRLKTSKEIIVKQLKE